LQRQKIAKARTSTAGLFLRAQAYDKTTTTGLKAGD